MGKNKLYMLKLTFQKTKKNENELVKLKKE